MAETVVYFVDFRTRELYRTVDGFRQHVAWLGNNSDGTPASIPQMQAARDAAQEQHDKFDN